MLTYSSATYSAASRRRCATYSPSGRRPEGIATKPTAAASRPAVDRDRRHPQRPGPGPAAAGVWLGCWPGLSLSWLGLQGAFGWAGGPYLAGGGRYLAGRGGGAPTVGQVAAQHP